MTSRILRKLDVGEAVNFILDRSPETKVYIGSDSERFKLKGAWMHDTMIAVVVHVDGCHGCKVFGQVVREPDYDQRKDRPAMRLMNEVVKVAEIFAAVRKGMQEEVDRRTEVLFAQYEAEEISERKFNKEVDILMQKLDKEMEIHLDINPDVKHGSSCVVNEAVGYIRGMCNVVPLIKPNAFAASFAADRGVRLLDQG